MSDEVEDEVVRHECVGCSESYPEDEMFSVDDGYSCTDCVQTCERCEWVGTSNDEWYNVDDTSWCTGCWEDHSFHCSRCEYTYNGDRISYNTVYGEGWRESWCEHCIGDHANYCENCDEYTTDDESGCARCGESEDNMGIVHAYSYKPNPIFHGSTPTQLYMGFELEMELNSLTSETYREAVSLVKPLEEANTCYLKSDSSINGTGFELVTHPHTLGAYEEATSLAHIRTDSYR